MSRSTAPAPSTHGPGAATAVGTVPAAFSYTPTGRAVPASVPPRASGPHPAAPSCTPTGRVVAAVATGSATAAA